MKTILLTARLFFLTGLYLTGCAKLQTQEPASVQPCPNSGAFVRELKQVVGTVYYDATKASYGIQVATSMDSADMGLTCNLPAEYQKSMTKVRFSGRYYERDKPPFGPAGYRYYYLTVSSVSNP